MTGPDLQVIAEGLRLMGEAHAGYRTAQLIEWREGYGHPLAEAHRLVARGRANRGRDLVARGVEGRGDDPALAGVYSQPDPRSPDDFRRQGVRAARLLMVGATFGEALEEQARRAKLRRLIGGALPTPESEGVAA